MSPEFTGAKFLNVEHTSASRVQYQNHLAAVAEEALRIKEGEFVHGSLMSVVRAINKAIIQDNNGDPRLLSAYQDKTLAGHVSEAGHALVSEFSFTDEIKLGHLPVVELINNEEEFMDAVSLKSWRQTLRSLTTTLPKDTTSFDIAYLLIHAAAVDNHKSIEERIKIVRGYGYKPVNK